MNLLPTGVFPRAVFAFLLAGSFAVSVPASAQSSVQNQPAAHGLPAPDAVPDDGMDVREYVSNELAPAERDYMRAAVNKLSPSIRQKILSLDPSRVSITVYDSVTRVAHSNRPEFAGSVEMKPDFTLPGEALPPEVRGEPLPNTLGAGEDAATTPVDLAKMTGTCPSSPPPGCYAGSGPYRRIFTNRVKAEDVCPDGVPRPCSGKYANTHNYGYWNAGTVSINCQAGSFQETKTIGEAGFVYLGGWSPTASSSDRGSIVDAGLQYNYEIKPGVSKDDYALFLKISGEGALITKSSSPPGIAQPYHIACEPGGYSNIEFHIEPWELNFAERPTCKATKSQTSPWDFPSCATLALVAQRGWGVVSLQLIIWLAPDTSYGGWGHLSKAPDGGTVANPHFEYFPQTPCGGCVFKWMSSIGQQNTNGKSENLVDGSHYSVTWKEREIAPWAEPGVKAPLGEYPVPMTDTLTYCSEYPVWTVYDQQSLKGDCKNTPKGLTGVADVIQVTNYSTTGETDTISLAKH